MAEFISHLWDAIPGATSADKWPILAVILTVVGIVLGWLGSFFGTFRWIFGLFQKAKKSNPDTAHTEAAAGAATRELATQLVEQTNRAQAAETEAGALRDQVLENENQIAGLTEAIKSLKKKRLSASPEDQATIDDALAYLDEGRSEEATAVLRKIAEERAAAGATANREAAVAYRHLGAMAFLNDTQEALSAYAKAVELNPDDADGWKQLGHLQRRLGELADAERSYQKVLALGNRIENKELIAIATGNLGVLYSTRGDLDQAEAMYKKSLEIDEALGRKEGMANQYGNLGILYSTRGDLDDAEAMYQKSLELNEALGRKEGMASAYGNLGNLFKSRGDQKLACEHYRKARALCVEIGLPHRVEWCDERMKEAGCEEA